MNTILKRARLNNILAEIGGKTYKVAGLQLQAALNQPLAISLTIGHGASFDKRYEFNNPDTFENALTDVTVKLYYNGQKEGIVLFRGFVGSVARQAGNSSRGSTSSTVLNCFAPPQLLQSVRIQGYRYWSNKLEGSGQPTAARTSNNEDILNKLGDDVFYWNTGEAPPETRFNTEIVEHVKQGIGLLTKFISRSAYNEKVVTEQFAKTGRTIKPQASLVGSSCKPEPFLLRRMKFALQRVDPYSTLGSVLKEALFINMAPTTAGNIDPVPAIPWIGDPVGTITRNNIVTIEKQSLLDADTQAVDGVMVPVLYESGLLVDFVAYPEKVQLGTRGSAKVINVPDWLNPYLGYTTPEQAGDKPKEAYKTDKAGAKIKNTEIDALKEQMRTIAGLLAKLFFNEVKNSSATLTVEVPWYRFEFLDALGYLIEIEQPDVYATDTVPLYGYLAGVQFVARSTPGGSAVNMRLTFSHVRSKTGQEKNALKEHPLYVIDDPKAKALKAFMAKPDRVYDRSTQTSLQGGSYDNYLSTMKELFK